MSEVRFGSSTSCSNSPPEIEESRPLFARPPLPYEGCNTAVFSTKCYLRYGPKRADSRGGFQAFEIAFTAMFFAGPRYPKPSKGQTCEIVLFNIHCLSSSLRKAMSSRTRVSACA